MEEGNFFDEKKIIQGSPADESKSRKNIPVKMKKTTFWKILTSVFAVLFVASLFTGGFGLNLGSSNNSPTGKLTAVLINDQRCAECDTTQLVTQLISIFPGLEVEQLDYSDKKGKELYDSLNLDMLPALLFTEKVKEQASYAQISNYLVPAGDYLMLMIGADFDPAKEICDNGVDDTGNGLADCEDPDCSNTLECNPNLFADCAEDFDLSPEIIIFYYSDGCGFCQKMKPSVLELKEEGYLIKSVDAASDKDAELINTCFRNYMGGGVPQFVCIKKSEIKTGAFLNDAGEGDTDALREWIDACNE